MKLKEFSQMIRDMVEQEEETYQKFFKRALKRFNVKSPEELNKKERRDFFVWVDTHYQASDERQDYQDYEYDMNESTAKELFQQSSGKEKFFYDILNDYHDELDSEDYYNWLSNELVQFGHDISVTSDNIATSEETLFKSLKNYYGQ